MPFADPEAQRQYDARRYVENCERIKAAVAARHSANPNRSRQYGVQYRNANKQKLKETNAAYYQREKSNRDAAHRRWVAAHPEARARHNKLSKRRHPESAKDYKKRRKARIRGASTIEKFKASEIYKRDNWICGICQHPIVIGDESIDHVIPVSKGGQHTRKNVRAAHYVCNRNRGNRP